jgi:hypothetical protein
VLINRQDFVATTANKQLNIMQHIKTLLKLTGEAVVLPDNVLFCLIMETINGDESFAQLKSLRLFSFDNVSTQYFKQKIFHKMVRKFDFIIFTNICESR